MNDAGAPAATTAPDATSARAGEPCVRLRRLSLRDFRNLTRADIDVPADGLAIVGENGHGKSNLLEAVYYLELLRSARGARDADVVRFDAPAFYLAADVETPAGERRLSVGFERQTKRKKVVIDGGEVARLSDALGALPSVLFSPRDSALVAGAPSERRRYLDVALSLTSRRYLTALQAYRGALARRNAALRDAARRRTDDDRVAVWEPALAEHGAVLWSARVAWVDRWAPELTALCTAIGEREPVRMRYTSALVAEGAIADALLAALAARRPLDLKRGLTHAGPHRDDLALLLGGRDLRLFGSAGQQRTAALALRVLEARTLRDHVGAAPLLLLDDPFAELDARRAHRILALLGDGGLGQTLLAVPRAADIPAELLRLQRRAIVDGALHDGAGAA